jgi:hypothetical protein
MTAPRSGAHQPCRVAAERYVRSVADVHRTRSLSDDALRLSLHTVLSMVKRLSATATVLRVVYGPERSACFQCHAGPDLPRAGVAGTDTLWSCKSASTSPSCLTSA